MYDTIALEEAFAAALAEISAWHELEPRSL